MSPILLALSSRGVTPGPVDATAALVCLAFALACTSVVGWWAHRLEQARLQREMDELAAATPVAGVH